MFQLIFSYTYIFFEENNGTTSLTEQESSHSVESNNELVAAVQSICLIYHMLQQSELVINSSFSLSKAISDTQFGLLHTYSVLETNALLTNNGL